MHARVTPSVACRLESPSQTNKHHEPCAGLAPTSYRTVGVVPTEGNTQVRAAE